MCQWLDLPPGTVVRIPINHNEGNYICDAETLARLDANGQVVLRYCEPDGSRAEGGSAPNGALDDIAGICNERGNVFGLMPHPERVVDPLGERDRRPAVLHDDREAPRGGGGVVHNALEVIGPGAIAFIVIVFAVGLMSLFVLADSMRRPRTMTTPGWARGGRTTPYPKGCTSWSSCSRSCPCPPGHCRSSATSRSSARL